MPLAVLEVYHSRPVAPTRRVALGQRTLPADPAPGWAGVLLGGIAASHGPGVADDVLDDYVGQDSGAAELVAAGFSPELVEQVLTMTDRAEYKRRQYPPGPKISFKAFGRDRRLPITSRWRENTDELDAP